MKEVIVAERKGSVLVRPTLPCLTDCHTINLTAGCPFGCRYCYAQGYANNPGRGLIKFYRNSDKKLAAELYGKKSKPKMIFFSTATDPFIPYPEVLNSQYAIMEILLKNRIPLLILTKASIPERFIELFSQYSELVNVQLGLTTTDDRVRVLFEPNAATVAERLRNLASLEANSIKTELRLDPLILSLTDTDRSLRALFQTAARKGCRQAVASFLHIRKSNRKTMSVSYGSWNFEKMLTRFYSKTIGLGNDGAEMLLPSEAYRTERFEAITRIGEEFGIVIKICGCKNPDIANTKCLDRPKEASEQIGFDFL